MTMPKAASVSNLPCPYGCSLSGGSYVYLKIIRPAMLFKVSLAECAASPRILNDFVTMPANIFMRSTAKFKNKISQRTVFISFELSIAFGFKYFLIITLS